MNELMSVALVAAFFGITIALAVVVATASRAARQVLRAAARPGCRQCDVADEPARRRGGRSSTRRTRRYWYGAGVGRACRPDLRIRNDGVGCRGDLNRTVLVSSG